MSWVALFLILNDFSRNRRLPCTLSQQHVSLEWLFHTSTLWVSYHFSVFSAVAGKKTQTFPSWCHQYLLMSWRLCSLTKVEKMVHRKKSHGCEHNPVKVRLKLTAQHSRDLTVTFSVSHFRNTSTVTPKVYSHAALKHNSLESLEKKHLHYRSVIIMQQNTSPVYYNYTANI